MPTRIADLHIHSHFSRATSKNLDFEHLTQWAQLKGVHIVGTGDISHPGWLQEMRDKLEPAEEGLFRLKPEIARAVAVEVPAACRSEVRFLLAGEISNIYKRADPTAKAARSSDVRKVHNLIFAPTLAAVETIQIALEKIGNIRADGRPILGLDSRDLLEIVLEVDARCALIPAHIWTPWFSMLGSKSGFDSVEACFGDLTPHIFALETGLSSDPPMNWRVSNLDGYTLISNSDAHSPPKLAREATIFHCELSYDALFAAMRRGDPAEFGGTLEFFPEEGKYHNDGHRSCGVCWQPEETVAHGGRCSVCGKPVTVGVLHRVAMLADRPLGTKPAGTHPYTGLIPLPEILAEALNVGPQSRRVQREYHRLLDQLGPELAILREIPTEEIARVGGERLALGIQRMRQGQVQVQGGYDGEYGTIKVFAAGLDALADKSADGLGFAPQLGLFGAAPAPTAHSAPSRAPQSVIQDTVQSAVQDEPPSGPAPSLVRSRDSDGPNIQDGNTDADAYEDGWQPLPLFDPGQDPGTASPQPLMPDDGEPWVQLNAEQAAAVQSIDLPLLIVAGPGTGKTHTLITRIVYLIQARQAAPESILAITFTNKAAEEMSARLTARLGATLGRRVTVQTFHALGAQLLREFGGPPDVQQPASLPPDFGIADAEAQVALLAAALPDLSARARAALLTRISAAKNALQTPAAVSVADPDFADSFARYDAQLRANGLVDYDDLIALSVRLLEASPAARAAIHKRYRWISVDEYQDVNAAQVRLLKLWVGPQTNLCAIGDPDQAIYGFRGADYRHFLAFSEDFPGAATFTLQRNYRSPQSLLTAAQQVIAKNPDRMALSLWSDFVEMAQLDVHSAPTDRAEAEYIVQRIEQMVGGISHFSLDSGRAGGNLDAPDDPSRSFGDFAVLVRLHAQVAPLAEALDRSGIPFQVVGGPGPYTQADSRWLIAGLQCLQAPYSPLALARLCAGDAASLGQLQAQLAQAQPDISDPVDALQHMATGAFPNPVRTRAALLAQWWPELTADLHASDPADPADFAIGKALNRLAAFCAAHPSHFPTPHPERLAHLQQRAQSYGNRLPAFLESLALARAADAYDPRADRVTLMTLHAAKGLEFPVVFLAGCEEGLLPYLPPGKEARATERTDNGPTENDRTGNDHIESDHTGAQSQENSSGLTGEDVTGADVNVEEERRLFYVGLTRAQARLILTHARRRLLFGRTEARPLSRFVDDIEATLKALQTATLRPVPKPRPEDHQLSLF